MDTSSWVLASTSLLPFLSAGVLLKFSKDYSCTEKELKAKITQAKESIVEHLAVAHTDLLEAFNLGTPLRGQPPHTPDPAGRYSGTLRTKMSALFQLEVAAFLTITLNTVIYYTLLLSGGLVVLGVIGIIAKSEFICKNVVCAAVLIFICQALVFSTLRKLNGQVDQIIDMI